MLIELTSEMAAATDPDYRPDPEKYPNRRRPAAAPVRHAGAHHVSSTSEDRRGAAQAFRPTISSRGLVHAEVDGERLDEHGVLELLRALHLRRETRPPAPASRRDPRPHGASRRASTGSPRIRRSSRRRRRDPPLRHAIIYFRRTATQTSRSAACHPGRETAWRSGTSRQLSTRRSFADPQRRRRARAQPARDVGRGGPHFCLVSLARLRSQDPARGDPRAEHSLRAHGGPPVRLSSNFRQRLQVAARAGRARTLKGGHDGHRRSSHCRRDGSTSRRRMGGDR